MKTQYHRIVNKVLIMFMAMPLSAAIAAPGALSTSPLYLSTTVEPNIVFLNDDSGSMAWDMMTPETDGVYTISSSSTTRTYWYVLPTDDNWLESAGSHKYTAPTQATMDADSAWLTSNGYSGWEGVWRLRNSSYNSIYYNPAVTYTPWLGVDDSSIAYGNINPASARLDPYQSAGSTVDLTTDWSYTSYLPSTGFSTISYADTVFPARHFQWTDTNSNTLVDASDTHTLIEIKPVTPTYAGSAARSDCASAPTCTYAEEIQNFANWFSYYRRREQTMKNALGSVVANITSARVAYGTINNNNSVNLGIASMNADPASGNKKALLDKVFLTTPGTPGIYTPLRQNLRNVGRYYACASNNFYGASGSACPILDAASGGECQQNFTILMTDGYYNSSSPDLSGSDGAADSNTDGDANTTFDGGDYADAYDNTLADVAMHYYERDLNTTLNNLVPKISGVDEADHQHMVTYSVAFGVNGTLDPDDTKTPGNLTDTDPSDAGFTWPDPTAGDAEKIDDLWHAAYNGRGGYLSASDPQGLIDSLNSSLSDIVGRTSSAAAVAFNSTSLGTGSVVYLARFNSATWSGELLAYNLDPFTGVVASLPSWDAADSLDSQATSSRVIYTYKNSTNAGIPFSTLGSLTATQQADLNKGPSAADGLGQQRLDYLRGDRSNEGTGNNFRIRSSVLGDIVHSNPVYVGEPLMGYPDADPFGTTTNRYSSFKSTSRNGVIYVGANDGMLHGFDESTGNEVMAYIPSMLFSSSANQGLHYLTDPAYTHRYYNDLSPSVSDAYIKTTTAGAVGWKTVLIGGLRGGGKGLFALDVSNPTNYSDANADNIVMWEFTDSDDADLGYTFSKPTMALTNAEDGSGNKRWAAVVGNGYNNTGDGEAKLFIIFLDGGLDGVWTAGTDYIEITTGIGSPGAPDGLATPAIVDTNKDGIVDRVYAGDLSGNLWAFDLSATTTGNWDIAYKQGGNNKALFSQAGQPITTKPVVVKHPTEGTVTNNEPNLMVFFGTGQYIVNGDKTTTGTQTMYGVWDDKPNASGLPYVRSNLIAQTLDGSSTATVRVLSDNAVAYSSSDKGWYFDLPTSGERIAVNPKVRGDLVFFNSMIPNNSACSYGGSGWLMAAKQVNGGRPDDSVFDVNNDGKVDAADLVSTNAASGKSFTEGLPAESNFLSDNQYTPGSSGELNQGTIDAGISIDQGRMSWREVLD